MIDDATFLSIVRGKNPADDLPPAARQFAVDTSDMRQNLPLLYAVAAGMGARRILEIGTSDGTSLLAFLKAAQETDGHVVSVDYQDVPFAQALVDRYEVRSRWTFMKGDSHEILPRLVAQGERFDVILVDGDHSETGARQDIADVEKMLIPGGVLFTHDNLMMASDHDWSRPMGERGRPGCGLIGREMLSPGSAWAGCFFPFGCNLGIWRRRADVMRDSDQVLNEARKQGLLP